MSQIDWSKAPEGATHWQPENSKLAAAWFKILEGSRMFKMPKQTKWTEYDGPLGDLGEMIPRPSAWTGEGLPPVGVMCECRCSMTGDEWKEVEILVHFKAGRDVAVFVPTSGVRQSSQAIAGCFRPIRTPEQIAKEVRAKACDEIYGVMIGVEREGNRSDMAEALYDAGYRKQADQ